MNFHTNFWSNQAQFYTANITWSKQLYQNMPQYEVHFHSTRNYLNYFKAPPTQFISNHLMLLDSIITLQSRTRTSAFREIMFSILVQEVETKRSYSFIFLVNTSSQSSMLLPESSFFLLTFGTNLFKLQSKGFILAKLKIDTIFRKNPTFIFPHPGQLQDPLHVINDLSMYFRLNHSGRILWFNCLPEPQIFLNASYSCVPLLCHGLSFKEHFLHCLQGCVSASVWNGSFC